MSGVRPTAAVGDRSRGRSRKARPGRRGPGLVGVDERARQSWRRRHCGGEGGVKTVSGELRRQGRAGPDDGAGAGQQDNSGEQQDLGDTAAGFHVLLSPDWRLNLSDPLQYPLSTGGSHGAANRLAEHTGPVLTAQHPAIEIPDRWRDVKAMGVTLALCQEGAKTFRP